MASFATLNSNNEVKRVIKIDNSFGADESQELLNAITSIVSLQYDEVSFKQTYFTGTSRKRSATPGGSYDPINDVFLNEKPYPSWVLDAEYDWVPPEGRWPHNPTDAAAKNIGVIRWCEDHLKFYGFAPVEGDDTQLRRHVYNFTNDTYEYEKDVPVLDWLQS